MTSSLELGLTPDERWGDTHKTVDIKDAVIAVGPTRTKIRGFADEFFNVDKGAVQLRQELAFLLQKAAEVSEDYLAAAEREWAPHVDEYLQNGGCIEPAMEGPFVERYMARTACVLSLRHVAEYLKQGLKG